MLPSVIGHRGAAAFAPENTLASFRAARARGLAMVEFDVRLSADGVPVVFHDDRLERTTDGSGAVGRHTLAQLKRLDAGRWFAPAFAGETIPTLAETLLLCRELDLAVNIEIKPDRGRDRPTALAAIETAAEVWPAERLPPLVSSFRPAALAAAAEAAPAWPRGFLTGQATAAARMHAHTLGCSAIHVSQRWLSAASVAMLRAEDFAVLAYTVNDPLRARTLWDRGVAAVFSDSLPA